MLAHLARIDESGRSAALAGFATNFGNALGPALAGIVLGEGGLSTIGWMCVAFLLASLAFAAVSLRRSTTNKLFMYQP
jgi:predicted MFS family arabinose efflux permease